jgi:REP element-mobilizing transposase RayT
VHERKLTRLTGFDYSVSRYYFVTICVQDHSHSFGTIENKSMRLSQNGIVAMEQWLWLGIQYPYIDLISFVIMPDHVHGIIYIDADFYNDNVGNGRDRSLHKFDRSLHKFDRSLHKFDRSLHKFDCSLHIHNRSQQSIQPNTMVKSIHKIKPLPELIGAYKTTVSKRIHMSGDVEFKWQKSYHDHIIRNIKSLNNIKHYIETNPKNWLL